MQDPKLEIDVAFKNTSKEAKKLVDETTAALGKANIFASAFKGKDAAKYGKKIVEAFTGRKEYIGAWTAVIKNLNHNLSDKEAFNWAKKIYGTFEKGAKKQEKEKERWMLQATTTVDPVYKEYKRKLKEASKNETSIAKEIGKAVEGISKVEGTFSKIIEKNQEAKYLAGFDKLMSITKPAFFDELKKKKSLAKEEMDFVKHRYESEEEKAKADWEHHQEQKKAEKKKQAQEEKDRKERLRKFLMFFGKWGPYAYAINKVIRVASATAKYIDSRAQEGLYYQRTFESGAVQSGFGKQMSVWKGAGFSGRDYNAFMRNLQVQRGLVKLGEGDAGLFMKMGLSAMDNPEAFAKQVIGYLKRAEQDVAMALGTRIGLTPDQVIAARQGELDKDPRRYYSQEAIKNMAELAKALNELKASIDASIFNIMGKITPELTNFIKHPFRWLISRIPFGPMPNFGGMALQPFFGNVKVTINNADGTQTETSGEITISDSYLNTFQQGK